ncbi:MAG TPA: PQQ-dependent sugar dehydrogenase [Gemmatimonadales bacterium]|nr:PQQ-dependent sugar dehydrogenase [Gemmatimonadales bacterium]
MPSVSLRSRAAALLAPLIFLLAARPAPEPRRPACADDNGGLVLAEGLCAVVVASDAGGVRQLTVGPDGALYAALARGGAGVLALRDRDGDGKPEERETFGPGGANDVALHEGYLYLALNDRVLRWKLTPGRLVPAGEPETVVADLPDGGDHQAKSLAFGPGTTMYVNIASATNSCQRMNRMAGSQGLDPCRELERRAGIWAFDAVRQRQRFADGRRVATGLRNASALTTQPGTGAIWAAVQGRDQLGDNWGFSDQANAENPAEELVHVQQGDDFGWPYCYFSVTYDKKVLAPEYGGDGRKIGRCAAAKNPVIAFPGHWGPLALAFHDGEGLGPTFRDGLFVAFHGSWNRAPMPQAGYRVVFAPFVDGKATGKYITVASGRNPTGLRPSGLAVADDGSLFVAADANGKIWRIVRAS